MAKILIVDDEAKIREVIREYAQFNKYETDEAEDGMQAVGKCLNNDYDLIIMDIMMPRLDGYSACKEIRKQKDIPIIMLSARGEEYDRLRGFELGADDYVVKPFSPRELMMRIKVAVSRSERSPEPMENRDETAHHDCYRMQGLVVDYTSRKIFVDGQLKDLTHKEYELLVYLIANKNIALTRNQILSAIWGFDYYGDDRTLDTHIKMLRGCLGPYRDMIKTLRGVGYRFDEKKD